MTRVRREDLDTSWKLEAECGSADPLLFELADRERWKPGRFDEAAEYCSRCPVLRECDEYATRGKEKWGFWALRDRGEAKHEQRIANAEAKALREAGLPVPGDEGEAVVRLALADEATGGRPDRRSA